MQKKEMVQPYEKQATISEEWAKIFEDVKVQFMDLPDWAQGILLEDISVALQKRITVIHKAITNT